MNHPSAMHPWLQYAWKLVPLATGALFLAGCAAKSTNPRMGQPYCRYVAASHVKRPELPSRIYFFPPLLSDAKAKPKEPLKAIPGPDGSVADWAAPSAKSKLLRSQFEKHFRSAGYEIVTFQEVLAMKVPHSILIVSSFYTDPRPVDQHKPGQPDQCILTMIKANTFDLDLDPKKSKALASVDGLTFYYSENKLTDPESKSFAVLSNWLGDEVSGMTFLLP